jgi:hypothetical protein
MKEEKPELNATEVAQRFIRNSPIPDAELVRNLAVYMNRQLLSRILFMQELYRRIIEVHGVVIEFGTRWGQNMAIFHGLRGMLEPFNMNRKLVCFDTFGGFPGVEAQDGTYEHAKAGGFSVTSGYEEHLQAVLEWHESQSPLSQIRRFEICKGDAVVELRRYLEENPQTIVALAYFDMDLYRPTKECLELLKSRFTRGSVVGFDEMNVKEWQGETIAYREVFPLDRYAISRWPHSSGASYIVVD